MNRDVITERVVEAIRTCENAVRLQDDPSIVENSEKLRQNLEKIEAAHSNSWMGYHANVYYRDFSTPLPGDYFSCEWGLSATFARYTSVNWIEYETQAVETAAMAGVAQDFREKVSSLAGHAEQVFLEARAKVSTVVDVLLEQGRTPALERLHDEIGSLNSRISVNKIIAEIRPTRTFMTRDSEAVAQGMRSPPHVMLAAQQVSLKSPFDSLISLVRLGKRLLDYMELHDMADHSAAQKAARIFIGHGRSLVWRELKDFLQDRLQLAWDEFNREPVAGITTVARLQEMLNQASLAFLIMTAEDEHADGSSHARENVIHEVGLFQGRLGFSKAIVLLEDGCTEFSNITGLGQIRFPKGNIGAIFEEVRRVLEREGMICGE